MQHKFYIPQDDPGKVLWLQNFNTKLPNYAAALAIDAATLSSVNNDTNMYSQLIPLMGQFKEYSKTLASFKRQIANGTPAGTLSIPTPPPVPAATAVPAGIFNRITSLVNVIKENANYTETIGNDLGIIGTEINPDFDNAKPQPKLSIRNSMVYIKWKKEHTDAADVHADYDDGNGFKFIARITVNHFADPHLPAAGTTKIFKYKLRYVVDDHQVGFWSDDEEITVTGI